MTIVETVIAAAGILAQCLLLFAWFLNGRRAPLWSVGLYVAYHLLVSITLRCLHLRRHNLGVLNYVDAALDFALLASIVVELLVYTSPAIQWPSQWKRLVVISLTAAISFAALSVASLKIVGVNRSDIWKNRLDLLSSLLLCSFVAISEWMAVQLGAMRTDDIKAVERGLAMWAAFALITDLCHMVAKPLNSSIFDQASNASWVVMVGYWGYAIWFLTPRPVTPTNLPLNVL